MERFSFFVLLMALMASCQFFVPQEEEEYEFDIDLAFNQFLENYPEFEGIPEKPTTFFYYTKTGCPTCIVKMQAFLEDKTKLNHLDDFHVIYQMRTPKEGGIEIDYKIHELLKDHYPLLYDTEKRLSKMGVAPSSPSFIKTKAGKIDTIEVIHYNTTEEQIKAYLIPKEST